MKKTYMMPCTTVTNLRIQQSILMTSGTGDIQSNGNDLSINSYGNSSSGYADTKARGGYNVWDDDWSN